MLSTRLHPPQVPKPFEVKGRAGTEGNCLLQILLHEEGNKAVHVCKTVLCNLLF